MNNECNDFLMNHKASNIPFQQMNRVLQQYLSLVLWDSFVDHLLRQQDH